MKSTFLSIYAWIFLFFCFEQLFGSGKWRILIVHSYEESYVCYPDFNRLIGKEFRRNLYSWLAGVVVIIILLSTLFVWLFFLYRREQGRKRRALYDWKVKRKHWRWLLKVVTPLPGSWKMIILYCYKTRYCFPVEDIKLPVVSGLVISN